MACCPGGKQRLANTGVLPTSLLTVLSEEKGLGVKGQWLKIATGIYSKGLRQSKGLCLFEVCCVRCVLLVHFREPGGHLSLGRCEQNPNPKIPFSLKNPADSLISSADFLISSADSLISSTDFLISSYVLLKILAP